MAFPPPKEILTQLKDFWLGLKREQRIALAGSVFIVLAGLIALVYYANRVEWGLLYRGLPEENAAKVIEYLKQEKIPYQVEADGSIKVPKDKVPELRMALASQGVIGPEIQGFEIFDRNQLGATDFLQRVNYQRALEGELSRTISSLRAVESARVHLALPRESLFISEEKPPKASVFLKLKPGARLSRREVQGIVNLVASSVTGLTPENVTVVDTSGRVLYRENAGEEEISTEQLAYRRRLEEAYREKIEGLLAQALGPGHALARVSVEIDFTKEVFSEETYDPEGTAIRSELLEEEQKEGAQDAGVPGVKGALANKIEGNTKALSRSEKEFRRSVTKNYEVSKISRQRELSPGAVKRISVAVLVDADLLKPASETKEGEAQAAEDRLALVERLVKGAIGYNPDRGDQVEVISLPFEGLVEASAQPSWMDYVDRFARPVTEVLLAVLFLLFVVRPVLRTFLKQMEPEPPPPPEEALPGEGGAGEEAALEGEEPVPLPQEIALGIIQNQPERAAILVRRWLAEESEEDRQKALKEAEAHAQQA